MNSATFFARNLVPPLSERGPVAWMNAARLERNSANSPGQLRP
jgi:hypothetical protein